MADQGIWGRWHLLKGTMATGRYPRQKQAAQHMCGPSSPPNRLPTAPALHHCPLDLVHHPVPPWARCRAHLGTPWAAMGQWSGSGRDRWSCQAACIAGSRRHAQRTDRTACDGAPVVVRVGAATNMCFERFLATPRPPEARASFVPIVHHDVQHARASIWSKSSSNGSRELSECACGADAARVGSRRGKTYLHAATIDISSPQYNKSTAATGSLVMVRGARTTAHLSKHGSLSIPTILGHKQLSLDTSVLVACQHSYENLDSRVLSGQ